MAISKPHDEDLQKAIALSLQDETALLTPGGPDNEQHLITPSAQPVTTASMASTTFSLASMDRQAMEEERRARNAVRQSKRERSISPPELSRPAKSLKTNATHHSRGTKPEQTVESSPQEVQQSASSRTLESKTPPLAPSRSTYPRGVFKKTWAFRYERDALDVKLEEVLETSTLTTAVLSAFQWDTEWVMSKFDMKRTKLIFVMQAKTEAEQSQYRRETADLRKSLQPCFPPMEGQVNCMHSKLMLLFHPHKLRIVVPSANLVPYDWGETGIMENSMFMIDLPRFADGAKNAATDLTAFGREIMYFVERMGLDEKARDGMLHFDYSQTSRFAFVHSVGGVSSGEDLKRTGHMGLNKAVTELGLQSQSLQIDFAASSIGSLYDGFLELIHRSARGQGHDSIPLPSKKTSATATTTTPRIAPNTGIKNDFRIYFPTLDTVKSSNGGTDNGGTICLQRQWYTSAQFPQPCFRDYRSIRKGLLSHNKILYARGYAKEGPGAVAWAYVGSANLSESAWGKMTWDRQRKEAKMSCRNWECGVVIPVPVDRLTDGNTNKMSQGGSQDESHLPDMGVFEDIVDVPFVFPAESYNGKQPWYFMDH